MKQSEFPEGWDEERVKNVLSIYEKQGDEDAVAEDEAGTAIPETVVQVPRDLSR
jgi:hypothetical protein